MVMRGKHAPQPTRLIVDKLAAVIPTASLRIIRGAGHMGPITHAEVVNDLAVSFLLRVAQDATQVGRRCQYAIREAA